MTLNPQVLSFLQSLLYTLPVVLLSLTVHEFSHGLAAYWLGDPTAKNAGRLTLNPIRHLDPIGTLMLIFLRFGYAKPVPVNPNYFKKPQAGMAITSVAGPLSNLLLAFLATAFLRMFIIFGITDGYINEFLWALVIINVGLAVFNLLPISPLDGSKLLLAVLPARIANLVLRYEMYGMILIIVLLYTGVLSGPLAFLRDAVISGMIAVVNAIPV